MLLVFFVSVFIWWCCILKSCLLVDIAVILSNTVYPKKYAHGFVVLCFVVVMQSFIMSSHEVFIHIHQGCFAGTGAIVRLPQCQWSKPDGYGKISQCKTTTKHSKAKTVCIFLGIYCMVAMVSSLQCMIIIMCPKRNLWFDHGATHWLCYKSLENIQKYMDDMCSMQK